MRTRKVFSYEATLQISPFSLSGSDMRVALLNEFQVIDQGEFFGNLIF